MGGRTEPAVRHKSGSPQVNHISISFHMD